MDIAGSPDVALDLTVDPIPHWAGVVDTFAPAHSMSAQKWSRDIDTNLTGAFRAIQACLSDLATAGRLRC